MLDSRPLLRWPSWRGPGAAAPQEHSVDVTWWQYYAQWGTLVPEGLRLPSTIHHPSSHGTHSAIFAQEIQSTHPAHGVSTGNLSQERA